MDSLKKKKKLITIRKKETHRFENKLVLTGGERKEEEQDTGKGLRDANYYVWYRKLQGHIVQYREYSQHPIIVSGI